MNPSREADPHLWVAILAGGVGSRLWPASRPERPKPLLSLPSDRPMIRETVDRALAVVRPDRLAILAGEPLTASLPPLLPELGGENYWCEPRARGTGPALAWAAHRIFRRDPEAVLVSLHADHAIAGQEAFARLVRAAVASSRREDILMTLALPPDRPETGFGYIEPGRALEPPSPDGALALRIEKFMEKPDLARAREYVSLGYLWNTGIFVLPVARFLEEIRVHAPEIADFLPLLDHEDERGFFDATATISVDEAVFERSRRVGAVCAHFGWDDMGSWESLTRALPADAGGNSSVGRAYPIETRDSVIWAEDGPVVLYGVEGLVVARSGGITLVTTRERAREMKALLNRLRPGLGEGGAAKPGTPDTPGDADGEPRSGGA